MLRQRAAAELRADGRELSVRHTVVEQDVPHVVPNLPRHGIHAGVATRLLKYFEEVSAPFRTPAEDPNFPQEPQLIVAARDVQGELLSMTRMAHHVQPRRDPETEQQAGNAVEQPPARGGEVNPTAGARLVDSHRAVSGPEVAEEELDLALREAEHTLRNELLVRSQPEQPKTVEPLDYRVAPAARQTVGRRQSKRA